MTPVSPMSVGHLPTPSATQARPDNGARSDGHKVQQRQIAGPAASNSGLVVVGAADPASVFAARLAQRSDAAAPVGPEQEGGIQSAPSEKPTDLAAGYQFNSPAITTVVLGSAQNTAKD